MKCPRCGQPTHVLESRTKNMSVVRRRRCGTRGTDDGSCGYRFVTAEAPLGFRHQLTIEMTPQGFKMIKTAQPPPLEIDDE